MKAANHNMATPDLEATVTLLQEELEATNREVMLLTLELEQRVAERTAQLARSNQELLKEVAERIRAESEVKKLNRDLERRAALLEAANEELEAFSSSVSHDLRNPLFRLLGFASLLQETENSLSQELQRKYIDHICQAGNAMASLIDDLLRFAYSSQAELVFSGVDLDKLIAGIIAELQHDSQAQKVEWNRGPLPGVLGDAALLRQVFVNLLNNAVKYSSRRQSPRIEIGSIDRSTEEWTIFVRDNGVGFDSGKAHKLFGAFQRLHARGEFEGTGIGLANVRRIILRHGGRVWAEARPEQGATFYVSLPKSGA